MVSDYGYQIATYFCMEEYLFEELLISVYLDLPHSFW